MGGQELRWGVGWGSVMKVLVENSGGDGLAEKGYSSKLW